MFFSPKNKCKYGSIYNSITVCMHDKIKIHTRINMAILMNIIFFLYVSVRVWMCTSVRASQYITTFVTFHVRFYDWLICIIIRYLSCPHHVSKFSNVLTAYVTAYDSFCAEKNLFIIELVYVSLMSNPCKWTPKCFNCKQGNIYAFLYHMKNTFL